jgi:hypothetical protein
MFRPAGISRTEYACFIEMAGARVSVQMEPPAVPSERKPL